MVWKLVSPEQVWQKGEHVGSDLSKLEGGVPSLWPCYVGHVSQPCSSVGEVGGVVLGKELNC